MMSFAVVRTTFVSVGKNNLFWFPRIFCKCRMDVIVSLRICFSSRWSVLRLFSNLHFSSCWQFDFVMFLLKIYINISSPILKVYWKQGNIKEETWASDTVRQDFEPQFYRWVFMFTLGSQLASLGLSFFISKYFLSLGLIQVYKANIKVVIQQKRK